MEKKIVVSNYKEFGDIPEKKTLVIMGDDNMEAQDGYHTFAELYDHRITLWIAYCKLARTFEESANKLSGSNFSSVWRSKRHSDGELCFGTGTQFVLGISYTAGKQITYHIPIERWEETNFAFTEEKAPEYDGHTSADVIERLKKL